MEDAVKVQEAEAEAETETEGDQQMANIIVMLPCNMVCLSLMKHHVLVTSPRCNATIVTNSSTCQKMPKREEETHHRHW